MSSRDSLPLDRPASSGERLEILDVLRGFALLWVLLFNIFVFSGTMFLPEEKAQAMPTHEVDKAVDYLRLVFVENKGLSLFALMFGIGFGIMARRAAAEGRSIVPRFLRRQGVLLMLGLAHAVLLWGGDILVIYAVFGLFLIPFLKLSNRTVLISAVVIYLLPIPLYGLTIALQPPDPFTVARQWTGEPNLYGIWIGAFSNGDYLQVIQGNLAFLAIWWTMFVLNLYWPDVIGLFLLGLFIGRSRWVERVTENPSLLPGKWVVGSAAIGISGNILFAYFLSHPELYYPPSFPGLFFTAVQYTLAVPVLCFFYVSLLIWLWRKPAWRRRLRPLSAAGRMTLTNYLMQSFLCMFVFYQFGFGLFAKVGATAAVAIALAIFCLQVLLSRWWWSRGFAFGPVEWLWRRLSYSRSLPMKTSPSAT